MILPHRLRDQTLPNRYRKQGKILKDIPCHTQTQIKSNRLLIRFSLTVEMVEIMTNMLVSLKIHYKESWTMKFIKVLLKLFKR